MENYKCKILWDVTVQTDHEIYGTRLDVIVVQRDKSFCRIIALMMEEWIPKN